MTNESIVGRVFDALSTDTYMSTKQIANKIGVKSHKASRAVAFLYKHNYIDRAKRDNASYRYIKTAGKFPRLGKRQAAPSRKWSRKPKDKTVSPKRKKALARQKRAAKKALSPISSIDRLVTAAVEVEQEFNAMRKQLDDLQSMSNLLDKLLKGAGGDK